MFRYKESYLFLNNKMSVDVSQKQIFFLNKTVKSSDKISCDMFMIHCFSIKHAMLKTTKGNYILI